MAKTNGYAVTVEENGFGRVVAKYETREEAEEAAKEIPGSEVRPVLSELEQR